MIFFFSIICPALLAFCFYMIFKDKDVEPRHMGRYYKDDDNA